MRGVKVLPGTRNTGGVVCTNRRGRPEWLLLRARAVCRLPLGSRPSLSISVFRCSANTPVGRTISASRNLKAPKTPIMIISKRFEILFFEHGDLTAVCYGLLAGEGCVRFDGRSVRARVNRFLDVPTLIDGAACGLRVACAAGKA